ncbi:MAG: S-layer homology domain-containing protein [Oscillospiraceae bacterium]|nr:S-layer homology domain-containing protein [Oscillospiraceae bacterium]
MKKTSFAKMLVLVLAFSMVLSVFALAAETPAVTETPAAALNAEEPTLISMDSSETITLTFPLSNAQVGAFNNADAISWTMDRNETYANAGELIPVNGETAMFPNEVQSIALDKLTYSGRGAFKVSSVDSQLDGNNLVLTIRTQAATSSGNNSLIHGEGGAYMDIAGSFTLTCMADNVTLAVKDNVIVKPYASFHTMWEIYDAIDALAAQGDDDASTALPYAVKGSMGKSTAGYDMPYLIVAKDSKAVENWLQLCEQAESDPASLIAAIEAGKTDFQVPVLYSNIHSNEIAAVDGILEFAELLMSEQSIDYKKLTGLTEAGEAKVAEQRAAMKMATPELIQDKTTYLGSVWPSNNSYKSGKVADFDSYYTSEQTTVNVDKLLDDVFFILVPEQNVEGRLYITRESSNGFDLNRDNSFQVTAETQNMQHLIATFNPVSHVELHGQVTGFQVEPCDPPHEPNTEYDLLSNYLMPGGEAFGAAAVANNPDYQSYVIPMRDYLTDNGDGTATWLDPWDDMSTSYTPQFAMLQGCVAYTVELPAYSESARTAATYGMVGQSDFIAANKVGYFTNQLAIYDRCVNNKNSDAEVGPWFADVNDVEGAEASLFRPAYSGEGQNGQFFPECYIIPLNADQQVNLQAAFDMIEWLTRNDVKVGITAAEITYDGVTYPAGTMIVSMYQAKRAVANGALYDGTLITNWPTLYSEGITAFNYTRGFDQVVCAEPEAYQTIAAAVGTTLDYEAAKAWLSENAKTQFTGETGGDVIISNASEDSTGAVNALLQAGKQVAMITDGDHKGDFIVSYADFQTIADSYVLTATGVVNPEVTAFYIEKSPVVYVAGSAAKLAPAASGYVNSNYINWSSGGFNYDRWAVALMNFQTTADPAAADAIVGTSSLTNAELAQVQAGKTYVGYTSSAVNTVSRNLLDGIATGRVSGMDCLGYVTYPEETLVNASYIADGDDVFYGYGTYYFTAVPEGAKVLVQRDGSKEAMEGFLRGNLDAFFNGIQGFSYEGPDKNGNNVNVTLFANSLTQKVHQRDEFAFISNALFAGALTEEAFVPTEVTEPDAGFVDVADDAWYADAVDWAVSQQPAITQGTDETHFSPDLSCTREQAVTFLWRAAGSPEPETTENPFTDVDESGYAYKAILWAVEQGITQGTSATTFSPSDTCTRAHIVTFLYRAAGSPEIGEVEDPFTDVETGSWYEAPVLWAVDSGITAGVTATTFAPSNDCTRAMVVTFLYRADSAPTEA